MASLLSLRQISRKGKKREKKRERKRKERIVSRYTNLPLIIVSMIIFEMTASNSLSLSLSLFFYPVPRRGGRDSASFRRFNLAWKMCWRACARRITRSPRGIYTSSIGCMERGTLRAVAPIYPTFLCRESFSASLSLSLPLSFHPPSFNIPPCFSVGFLLHLSRHF